MINSPEARKVSSVIFDFDGTIADSFSVFTETLEEVIKRPTPLTAEEIEELRGLSTREVITKLGVKKWQLPMIAINGRRGVTQKMGSVDVFEGISEAINELTAADYKLFIFSSSSQEAIRALLGRCSLLDSFGDIYSGSSITGKAKGLRRLMKKERLTASECVYVGDETRDIEAAKQLGLKSAAVEWGYSTPESLQTYEPDVLIAHPADLLTAINSVAS
jgi:phosphoglycolate phosphatase